MSFRKSLKNYLKLVPMVLFLLGCNSEKSSVAVTETRLAAPEIRVSGAETDVAEPAIAADSDGNLYVLYVAHGANKSADVYLQKFGSQRKPNGEKVRVNPNLGEATAWRGDPPTIAVGADKTVYVGWTKTVRAAAKAGTELSLSVSRDGGKSFAAPVKVNDDIAPASHGMHSLAVGKDNSVYLAWLDERNVKSEMHTENFEQNSETSEFQFIKAHHNSNQKEAIKKVEKKHEAAEPNSEVFFAVSDDGGKTFSPNKKLSSEVCPCCKTSLLAAPDGRIYASWRQVLDGDFRHIAVASSNDAGKTFSAPTIVSDDRWQINACPVSGAALGIGENDTLKVIWFTGGDAGKIGLYETESTDLGATFAERRLISEGEVSGTPNVSGDGKVLWEADGKIYQAQTAANRDLNQTKIVSAGNLPSAVALNGKTFVVLVKKEAEQRAIWLTEF